MREQRARMPSCLATNRTPCLARKKTRSPRITNTPAGPWALGSLGKGGPGALKAASPAARCAASWSAREAEPQSGHAEVVFPRGGSPDDSRGDGRAPRTSTAQREALKAAETQAGCFRAPTVLGEGRYATQTKAVAVHDGHEDGVGFKLASGSSKSFSSSAKIHPRPLATQSFPRQIRTEFTKLHMKTCRPLSRRFTTMWDCLEEWRPREARRAASISWISWNGAFLDRF